MLACTNATENAPMHARATHTQKTKPQQKSLGHAGPAGVSDQKQSHPIIHYDEASR